MSELLDLQVPSFLAAMPHVDDPFFRRSLVLVLDHNEEGTYGMIVNRPTELTVREVLDGLEIEWTGDAEEPTFFGGPVDPQRGSILVDESARAQLVDQFLSVGEGLLLTHNSKDLELLARQPPEAFRLVLGSAGWDADQLAKEFSRHDWIVLPCQPDLIFSRDQADIWGVALTRAGISPYSIAPVTDHLVESSAN